MGGRAARGCDSAQTREGRAGPWMAQTGASYEEGSRAPGNSPDIGKRDRKDEGERRSNGQEGGPEAVERGKEKGKGLRVTFPTQRPRLRKASGNDNGMTPSTPNSHSK